MARLKGDKGEARRHKRAYFLLRQKHTQEISKKCPKHIQEIFRIYSRDIQKRFKRHPRYSREAGIWTILCNKYSVVHKKGLFYATGVRVLKKKRIFAPKFNNDNTTMIPTLLAQRQERDRLMSLPYLMRQTNIATQDVLRSPFIKLITGPRRAGKSVFALLMLRNENCAYLNFDDKNLLDKWNEDVVMSSLDEVYPNYKFLLLDEVQNLPQWDLWVSKLYRNGYNMVITGSNANMLSSEMATVLTGRYIPILMLPFRLSEMLAYHHIDIHDIRPAEQSESVAIADDFLRNGGFPETLQSRGLTQNYLNTLYDSIVWKDIVRRHRVRNTTDLYNLANYLLSNFCNPFTVNDITKELNISSANTTKKFCRYLAEPFLFFYLSRYDKKLKKMKKAAQKPYIVDNGFVQSSGFNLGANLGRLLENQVFVELLHRGYDTEKTLFYYRSRNDKETDFVTRNGTHIESLIQVCYDISSPKTAKRETDALVECAMELQCENLLIVTSNTETIIERDGYTIKVVPILKF